MTGRTALVNAKIELSHLVDTTAASRIEVNKCKKLKPNRYDSAHSRNTGGRRLIYESSNRRFEPDNDYDLIDLNINRTSPTSGNHHVTFARTLEPQTRNK